MVVGTVNSRRVYTFERSGCSWSEIAGTEMYESYGNFFGSTDYLPTETNWLSGIGGHTDHQLSPGWVHTYQWNNGSWGSTNYPRPSTELWRIPNITSVDPYASSDGNTLVVGSTGFDNNCRQRRNSLYISMGRIYQFLGYY